MEYKKGMKVKDNNTWGNGIIVYADEVTFTVYYPGLDALKGGHGREHPTGGRFGCWQYSQGASSELILIIDTRINKIRKELLGE